MNTKVLCIIFLLSILLPFSSFSRGIEVLELKPGVYIYRSYFDISGQLVSANGLIVESDEYVALIDTPWENIQTVQLLDWIRTNIGKPVAFAVITHAHNDRIGGIDMLKARKIPAIANVLTFAEATKNNFAQPDFSFRSDTLLTFGNSSLEVYYPGPGHSLDNSVVYLNGHHILYGGCFIKSAGSVSLGNLEDAVIAEWPASIERVKNRYPNREGVIPGHGDWNDGAIEKTLELLENL